jgi:hypothetical protein
MVRVSQTVRTTGTRTMRVIVVVWMIRWMRVMTSGSLICRLALAEYWPSDTFFFL